MGLSIGIVGLPNVGKSTLFNALTRAQNAQAANYPFCTIEPNKAVVPVPDGRLAELAKLVNPERLVQATVDFVDIAGLVRGANKGEGLGNKFLANIREADAILHVVRCFENADVVHVEGGVDPIRDIEIIDTELLLADLQSLELRVDRLRKISRADPAQRVLLEAVEGLMNHLGAGKPASLYSENADKLELFLKESPLLTAKKVVYCANVDEAGLKEDNAHVQKLRARAAAQGAPVVKISARTEEELVGLSDGERQEFLASYGVTESGLDQVARLSYEALGLVSYFTAGPKEARAWTIHRGWRAPKAAGVIHSDFEKGFIRAQVISYADYVKLGGESGARSAGVMRVEGKDYEVQDGDVVLFLFNS